MFRKTDRRWFDMHDHVSMPTDFDTGKAQLNIKP